MFSDLLFSDSLYPALWIGFGLCLLISALGFIRTDWFISIGYGLSVSALAIFWGWFWQNRQAIHVSGVVPLLQLCLLIGYGLRLAGYLIYRERTSSFSGELAASRQRSQHIHGVAKLAIWLSVSALYVMMVMPVALVLASRSSSVSAIPGVLIMVLGLSLELVADWQKSAAKARHPDRCVQSGLFAHVRYPNYLGEMVFWLGNFICGIAVYHRVIDGVLAGVGLVCIELIMLGSARRLELKQTARYGNDPAYIDYIRRVPILLPWVPLYSLRRLKVYLG